MFDMNLDTVPRAAGIVHQAGVDIIKTEGNGIIKEVHHILVSPVAADRDMIKTLFVGKANKSLIVIGQVLFIIAADIGPEP